MLQNKKLERNATFAVRKVTLCLPPIEQSVESILDRICAYFCINHVCMKVFPTIGAGFGFLHHCSLVFMRALRWWWYYLTPSEGWGCGGTPQRPNNRATPQGLDHRSRIEREEPKIDLSRGSEAGQSRKR